MEGGNCLLATDISVCVQVLDFMMSLDERSMWDDLYGVGRVEKNVRNVGQLLRIELWIPGMRKCSLSSVSRT